MLPLAGSTPPAFPSDVDPALIGLLLSPAMRALAFVWGALWGSFANVAIYRIPRGMSVVRPRSRCGSCERLVAWYDNIPVVSYLLLRGRCRYCGEAYSLRYLMVELIGGTLSFALFMLFVVAPLLEGGGIEGLVTWQLWFFFCLALVVVTYTDLDVWIIPNEVVLPMAVVGLVANFVYPDWLGVHVFEAVSAGAAGYLIVWGLRLIYLKWRGIEAMGLGDGKLLLMVGCFGGWPALAWTLGAGALQGILISVPLLLFGGKVANSDLQEVHGDDPDLGEEDPDAGVMGMRVPFGPFLALAALEFVLLRRQLQALFELGALPF